MSARKQPATAAQKAEWAAERDGKVKAAKEALEEGLKKLQSGDDWKDLLASLASSARQRLSARRYSFGNQVIVMATCWKRGIKGSGLVGTFLAWDRVGRKVKKGEKAIYILQPRVWKREHEDAETGETKEEKGIAFKPLAVFALGQTEGEELLSPESLLGEVEDDAGFSHLVGELEDVCRSVEGANVDTVEIRPRADGDHDDAAGWYVPKKRAIVVIDCGNRAKMFSTLVHETAHSILHSTGNDRHEYARNEVEAESVAYIVSAAMGLDVSAFSFPYVATWAERTDKKDATRIVQESGERICKAVNAILDALEVGAEEDEERNPGFAEQAVA